MRRILILIGALAVALSASACGGDEETQGGSDGGGKTVDLGAGVTPTVGDGKLKIAFFSAGSNNVYLQAGIRAAEETAEKVGADMTIYDAAFDTGKQFSQVQNANASGRFNAYVMEAVDPQQMCTATKNAYKNDILVSVINAPVCGRATEQGADTWEPGTVNFVGGTQTKDAFTTWLSRIAEDNPGQQKMAILMGPELGANSQNTVAALNGVIERRGDIEVVDKVFTDYSLPEGQSKAQNLLQANRDLTILATNYSDLTRGALQAVKQANRGDDVKVYDYGANRWAVKAVKAGDVELTGVMLPYTEVQRSVESLAEVWKGNPVPRFVDLAEDEKVPGTLVLDRETVDDFEPEY